MKNSPGSLFNISIMRIEIPSSEVQESPSTGVQHDLALLKSALLYGDNIELLTPDISEWNALMSLGDPGRVVDSEIEDFPQVEAVRRLVEDERISIGSPFDQSVFPSPDYVRSSVPGDNLPEGVKIFEATVLYLKNILSDPSKFPIFDNTSGVLARLMYPWSPGRSREVVAPLASYLLARLPNFEASLDEILDIRDELESPIQYFRTAVASMSVELANVLPGEFERAAELLWIGQVLPGIQEIDDAIRSNTCLAGGLACGITQTAAGFAIAAVPAVKAAFEKAKGAQRIQQHKFFFLHALSGRERI